jgi:hypothetical protein
MSLHMGESNKGYCIDRHMGIPTVTECDRCGRIIHVFGQRWHIRPPVDIKEDGRLGWYVTCEFGCSKGVSE